EEGEELGVVDREETVLHRLIKAEEAGEEGAILREAEPLAEDVDDALDLGVPRGRLFLEPGQDHRPTDPSRRRRPRGVPPPGAWPASGRPPMITRIGPGTPSGTDPSMGRQAPASARGRTAIARSWRNAGSATEKGPESASTADSPSV